MKYTFRIFRFDPIRDAEPRFQEFFLEPRKNMPVLEALMDIRNEQDSSLAFRYSCREAVCGSCAMVINGDIDLACRTMIESLKSRVIVLEPLPNLEVLKDLVVDMKPFYDALESVRPYIVPAANPPEKEFPIEDSELAKIEKFTNCILCGSCYAVCPVVTRDPRYIGSIAVAKFYRFVQDKRDRRPYSDWARVDRDGENAGAWGCDTVFRCNLVCPRYVRPADGIEAMRLKIVKARIQRLFGLKK